MIFQRNTFGIKMGFFVLAGMLAATISLPDTTGETILSASSDQYLAEALQQEAQNAADWAIDSDGNGISPLFAGGCIGNFIGPQLESNGAELLYGGRQECTQPVSQSLTFRLQRCFQTGICIRFTTVDQVSRTELVQAFTVTAQPACESTETNIYRLEVDAMANGVAARAISEQVELPCFIS